MPQIQCLTAGPPSYAAHSDLPHVLFVVDGFPKALGGGERIVLRLASLLPQHGFRASILTFSLHPESSFLPAEATCPVYLLPLTNTFGPGALQGALAFRRLLHAQRVQVVQTFFESSDLWAGLVTRLLSPAKLIWSRRDMGILRGRKHSIAYRALRNLPHAVFAVSARVAEHAVTVDGVPASRVRVVYNGLDLDTSALPQVRDASRAPVITTIGNIRRVKGHDLMLHALPSVLARFPETRFTVAGEVLELEFFAELQQIVAELGIGRNVSFLGKMTDLREHLASADLFVLPSRSEGFSNALVEAMATGVACVATDVGGNAEALQDGVSGLIVPPENSQALATAVLDLLEHPLKAEAFRYAARRTVEDKFTAEAMLRQVAEAYVGLLQPDSSPSRKLVTKDF